MPSATCCSCVARCPARATGSSRCASREAEAAMIEAPHYSATGTKKKAVRLPAALFDGTVNEHLLHRAVITYLANQRQGTHDTRTRSEVSGGYEKPKTKTLAELLAKLGVAEKKVLVVTAGAAHAHNVYLSGRNLPKVHVMRFADATAYEILWADAVVAELPALGAATEKAETEDA